MNPLFADQPTSIFEEMSLLARAHDAVNLGQGFPDFGWPEDVIGKAAAALTSGSNQYPPMRGLPELRQAIASHYATHQEIDFTAEDVTVTSGATEALAAALVALITPGDEVVLFQPLYDAYLPIVRRAGGLPRLVRLVPPDWRIREEPLAEAITPRTRLIVFNNPHNPTARLFGPDELALIADACTRHDLTAVTDEVWEHVVFDGARATPLSSMPGMRERTVKVGSAGKIFSLTGWKVGWVVAPPELAAPVYKAHQYLAFATPPNLQTAVAFGLDKSDDYFADMRALFEAARDALTTGLGDIGYVPLPAQGTYFLCVDLAASGIAVDDRTFSERAVREAGVAAIPVSAFYDSEPVRTVIRLCFAKQPTTIERALERLRTARNLFA